MTASLCTAFAYLALAANEPKVELLWPNGAPGAVGTEAKDKPTLTVFLPAADKANGTAVIATLKHEIQGLIAVNPEGGKEARASAVSPQIESGNVYLPHPSIAPWIRCDHDRSAPSRSYAW